MVTNRLFSVKFVALWVLWLFRQRKKTFYSPFTGTKLAIIYDSAKKTYKKIVFMQKI